MRSLVTGGAGAIGSRLVLRLLDEGHQVTVLDDLSSGHVSNLPNNVELITGSVADEKLVQSVVDQQAYQYVFHLAALFANQNSVDNPKKDLETNGFGTLNLAMALTNSRYRNDLRRMTFASSSCVYGKADGVIDESVEKQTDTPYAVTKLMGEHYLNYFQRQYALPTTIIRPFNSYGPGERPGRYRNVIPNFIRLAILGEDLIITGTGEETRDFTYVTDGVECFYRAATRERSVGETYNLGTGHETKIGDLAKLIIEVVGSRSSVKFVPRRAWDHIDRRCAGVEKIKHHLGFVAQTSVETGVRETVAWIKQIPTAELA